jgi:predicted NUDIX family NTP pyrophosphohydrolase
MAKQSAGLLFYRLRAGSAEYLLVHPGGPFWKNKDLGAWSIPKGEFNAGDDALEAAKREFNEETGFAAAGDFIPLHAIKQRSGKMVLAWLAAGDFDASQVASNTFSMEWPPRSGKMAEFPEIDRAEWFSLEAAREKILDAQRPLLDEAASIVERRTSANK